MKTVDILKLLASRSNNRAVSIHNEAINKTGLTTRAMLPSPSTQFRDYKNSLEIPNKKILNQKQQEACDRILAGEDIVFIGAAGTGKTFTMKETTEQLISQNKLPPLDTNTKYLKAGSPGAAIVSYTKKAVNNIRYAVTDELKNNTLTIHKLLEFAPEFYEVQDPNTGDMKKSMRFIPTRNRFNPLPSSLKLIIFEESSMISLELYNQLQDALPHDHQEVFIGDIQQLPPIFGMAILGFKLNTLPIVELTEIYRQALNSPIIDLAWNILGGNLKTFSSNVKRETKDGKTRISVPALDAFSRSAFNDDKTHLGTVKIQIWQKKLSEDLALLTSLRQFKAWEEDGYYNPMEDLILCPFNKSFGTIELNKGISNYLGKKRGAMVYEIIAGFNTHYLAVGDRVLYDKEDAIITSIRPNGTYLGKATSPPSINMDRSGHIDGGFTEEERKLQEQTDMDDFNLEAIEAFMEGSLEEVQDRVQAASHVIGIKFTHPDADDQEIVLDSANEINNLLGGYAITIHKAQGSQAKKVFLVLHQKHAMMVSRELLYTAITRAESWLHVICETDTFEKAVKSQRIKGNTIQEKAEFFKGRGSKADFERAEKSLVLHERTHHNVQIKDETEARRKSNVHSPSNNDMDSSVDDPSLDRGFADLLAKSKARRDMMK